MPPISLTIGSTLEHDTIIFQKRWSIRTAGRGLVDITRAIRARLSESQVRVGQCTIFLEHTSASLLITENADPTVKEDLERVFGRLAPDGDPIYQHDAEGPDDMAAHIRTALTQNSLVIPIIDGRLGLGTWQGICLWEHRYNPHIRWVSVTAVGHRR